MVRQTNREEPESRKFSVKQSATGAPQKLQGNAKWCAGRSGEKPDGRSILTDRSDSQIAENPESVGPSPGLLSAWQAPTLVTQLAREIVEVGFNKGLTSQDQAISEVANAAP
jgi:hypothetical protein